MDREEWHINSKTSSNHRLTRSNKDNCGHLRKSSKSDIINNNSSSHTPSWKWLGKVRQSTSVPSWVDEHPVSCCQCRRFYIMGWARIILLEMAHHFNTLSCFHFLPLLSTEPGVSLTQGKEFRRMIDTVFQSEVGGTFSVSSDSTWQFTKLIYIVWSKHEENELESIACTEMLGSCGSSPVPSVLRRLRQSIPRI